jgi:hypothetical protein
VGCGHVREWRERDVVSRTMNDLTRVVFELLDLRECFELNALRVPFMISFGLSFIFCSCDDVQIVPSMKLIISRGKVRTAGFLLVFFMIV